MGITSTVGGFIKDKLWDDRNWKFRAGTVLAGVFGVAVGGVTLTSDYTYSDGGRVGQVTKFSHKGVWPCKTWEGELAMKNFSSGGALTGSKTPDNSFEFSVIDESVAKKILEARDSGAEVSLLYNQKLFPMKIWPAVCTRATEYEIIDVKHTSAHPPAQQENYSPRF